MMVKRCKDTSGLQIPKPDIWCEIAKGSTRTYFMQMINCIWWCILAILSKYEELFIENCLKHILHSLQVLNKLNLTFEFTTKNTTITNNVQYITTKIEALLQFHFIYMMQKNGLNLVFSPQNRPENNNSTKYNPSQCLKR